MVLNCSFSLDIDIFNLREVSFYDSMVQLCVLVSCLQWKPETYVAVNCGDIRWLFLEEEQFVVVRYPSGVFSVHRKPSCDSISSLFYSSFATALQRP